jgi:hypothetical protein
MKIYDMGKSGLARNSRKDRLASRRSRKEKEGVNEVDGESKVVQ